MDNVNVALSSFTTRADSFKKVEFSNDDDDEEAVKWKVVNLPSIVPENQADTVGMNHISGMFEAASEIYEAYENGDYVEMTKIFVKEVFETLRLLFKRRVKETPRDAALTFAISGMTLNAHAIQLTNMALKAIKTIQTAIGK